MKNPPKQLEEKKTTFLVIRTTETKKVDFKMRASSEGITVSDFVHLKCLGDKPSITFATPERERLIKAIANLTQIVAFLNAIRPTDKAQGKQIDSAIKGALSCFTAIQSELNGN